jgi:hypothetical protein
MKVVLTGDRGAAGIDGQSFEDSASAHGDEEPAAQRGEKKVREEDLTAEEARAEGDIETERLREIMAGGETGLTREADTDIDEVAKDQGEDQQRDGDHAKSRQRVLREPVQKSQPDHFHRTELAVQPLLYTTVHRPCIPRSLPLFCPIGRLLSLSEIAQRSACIGPYPP